MSRESAKKRAKPTQQETLEFIACLAHQLQAMAIEAGEHEVARHLEQARDKAQSCLVLQKAGAVREGGEKKIRKVPERTHTA